MLISYLETKDAGFFSSFFFMINHYLYAKINKHSFRLNTENWLFKSENGWTDYFLPIDFDPFVILQSNNKNEEKIQEIHGHAKMLANYPMILYRNIIPEIYRLNITMIEAIENARTVFDKSRENYSIQQNITLPMITTREYGALFIRRGDKLIEESVFVSAEHYLIYLLEIYPTVQTVFVQTDDYNVFLELLSFQEKTPTIQHLHLYTLCKPELKGGMVITKEKYKYCQDPDFETNIQKIQIPQNQAYLRTNLESLKAFVPLEMQTPEQVREHTMDMLIGIDFLLYYK